MNRIYNLFQNKKRNILNIYFTAGYPSLESTPEIIKHLEKADVDLVEISIPFSDPLADGPTIQDSNRIALQNGMSLNLLFNQLQDIRKIISMPLILMGYFNQVFQYGIEEFCQTCQKVGIDGVILPDLPIREYESCYLPVFRKYELSVIFLIAPNTSEERIRIIDRLSDGFIYMVSSASVTGENVLMKANTRDYFRRVEKMHLKNPRLIGFGISDQKSFQRACQYANGAIVGSAFIRALSEEKPIEKVIAGFLKRIRFK